MTRFVKNLEGAVHSVVDEFILPKGWEESSASDASPALLGKRDKENEVTGVADHDGGGPVVDIPSTGTVGTPDTRAIDLETPSLPKTVFPDGKSEEYPDGVDTDANNTPVGETGPTEATAQ